jgi:hypothetical protein
MVFMSEERRGGTWTRPNCASGRHGIWELRAVSSSELRAVSSWELLAVSSWWSGIVMVRALKSPVSRLFPFSPK